MRIAISALSAVGGGGVTYFQNLFPALARLDTQNEYHIFIPQGHPLISSVVRPNFVFHECLAKNQSAIKRFLWEQFMLSQELKKWKIDVLFTAKNLNVFFAPCKTVIAIRNTEPFKYREYQNDWKLNVMSWIRWQLTQWSVRKADHVVAVSQTVREALRERFPGIENKVSVVYNGNPIQNPIQNGITPIGIRRENYYTQPYILTASKFVAYANQLNLVDAYARMCTKNQSTPLLFFAGGVLDKKYFAKVKKLIIAHGIDDRVRILGLLPHDRLMELMCSAAAFVFPSTLEACPHTLIEAMACGVPIATSNTPPMPEICTNAAVYFNSQNPQDIAEKIEQILADQVVRRRLRSAGLARAKFFTWDKTAQQLVKIFTNL